VQFGHHNHHLQNAVVMTKHAAEQVQEKVDPAYRSDSRRIFATLIREPGDFELAKTPPRCLSTFICRSRSANDPLIAGIKFTD
jgi:hypothetical protein